MIYKNITVKIDPNHFSVLDNEILKTAAYSDVFKNVKFDPDFVYLYVRGVSAGEYWGDNNNTDYFEEAELVKSYNTFMDAKVFKNHENKEVEKSIGDVLTSEWDDTMKAAMLVIRVDKKIAPTITRGILTGVITDVSMGCKVGHVVCSICGAKAVSRKDYCEHLRNPDLRKKIQADGKKVYEINRDFRFHDISIVTKGADSTAKAFKVIDGAKGIKEDPIQKAASSEDLAAKIGEFEFDENSPVVDTGTPASMLKIAEIDKIIKSNIVAIAGGEEFAAGADSMSEVADVLRLFHTEYMDESKISEIVAKIKNVAATNKKDPMEVFKTFLRTAELAGIELSPLEFSSISSKLKGNAEIDRFALSNMTAQNIQPKSINIVIKMSRGKPSEEMRHIISDRHDGGMEKDFFSQIFESMMPGRSQHKRHLIPRMLRMRESEPMFENIKHFVLPLVSMSKSPHVSLMDDMDDFSAYQNDRADLYGDDGFERYANELTGEDMILVKEALEESSIAKSAAMSSKAKAIATTATLFPLVYGYSDYQKSKIMNGERVGSFDRYVAEHPLSAYVVSAIAASKGRKYRRKILEGADKLGLKAKNFGAKAKENISAGADQFKANADAFGAKVKEKMTPVSQDPLAGTVYGDGFDYKQALDSDMIGLQDIGISKTAAIEEDALPGFSILKNAELDTILRRTYSVDQLNNIKIAMVGYFKGDEIFYDEIMKTAGLSDKDVNCYLNTAKDLVRIELEKRANDFMDVAKSTLGDTLFYPKAGGGGFGTMLPGSIIDGFVFTKLLGGDKKKQEPKKPELDQEEITAQTQGGLQ